MKQAVRPAFFTHMPSLEKKDEEKIPDEEQFLFGMSKTAGWDVFTKRKESLLHDMDIFQETTIASGGNEAEIGKNAIIISMVKGVIQRLWTMVDDAKEACEPSGGK
jgi:hypothetical protein